MKTWMPISGSVYDRIASGPRGGVHGPLRVWLQEPRARRSTAGARRVPAAIAPRCGPRLSELAIIVTASVWRSGFEWTAHAPKALEAGIDAAAVEAIRKGERPLLSRPDEASSTMSRAKCTETRTLCDATYGRAVEVLGEVALIDLVGVLGYYATISMTINVFRVDIPAGPSRLFETCEPPHCGSWRRYCCTQSYRPASHRRPAAAGDRPRHFSAPDSDVVDAATGQTQKLVEVMKASSAIVGVVEVDVGLHHLDALLAACEVDRTVCG